MNQKRVQSSPLVDLKDPIQVHLLTETALSDSKEWEILSQEEVDDLKKQVQSLSQRISQTRNNLAIQSKYRDAATAMAKLYSPVGKRKSLLGNRNSGGETAREAEAERQACEKRCEELASELFSLEKRIMEPQRRLLQHTAGILQLTHGASRKQPPVLNGQPLNGIPGSPESMITYTNSRDSLEPSPEESLFGDNRAPFSSLDQARDGKSGSARKNPEIPMKSPVRQETKELREETDRLKEEKIQLQEEGSRLKAESSMLKAENSRLLAESAQLRAANDSTNLELDALQRESDEQMEIISDTEKRIEELNSRLRDAIVRFNPDKNRNFKAPPSGDLEPGDLLESQLKYLDNGLVAVQEEQELWTSMSRSKTEAAASAAAADLLQAEAKFESVNREVRAILQPVDSSLRSPPAATGTGLNDQINWLQDALLAIKIELNQGNKGKAEEVDKVLVGLWDLIQSGFATIQREREERRKMRSQKGLQDEDDDLSGDESPFMPNESYSFAAFPSKIQWLYTQATKLRDQKSVLKRQVKQQRDLNTKSDGEKDYQLKKKTEELQKTSDALERAETDGRYTQEQLTRALSELEELRESNSLNKDAAEQLKDRNAKYAALETASKDLSSQLVKLETEIASLSLQLNDISEAKLSAESKAEAVAKEAKDKDEELERLNGMLVELKMEATIAKAELEGAYGSRAQRAADVAELAKSKENSQLQGQLDKLKVELAGTLKELEDLTKDTITAEREKLELEGKLDDALASRASVEAEAKALRERLEAEIAELKSDLDAEKLKVAPSSGGGTSRAGASMLSEQFRATMKEERKKFQEELRV
jgi:hypothetical protein